MSDLKLQQKLIEWGLLDPPADGKFGKQSEAALKYACDLTGLKRDDPKLLNKDELIPLKLDNSYASRIIKYMLSKNYFVARGENMFNIVYIEGINDDGTTNPDTPNIFNDLRTVIEIPAKTGVPRFMGMWNATTEPGNKYTQRPLNAGGAFRIKFGQYKAWTIGTHKDHEALVQAGELEGHRDFNKDHSRVGDKIVKGSGFGVNQHWGYDLATVEGASAGCLVGRTKKGHREFMTLIKRDRRYVVNPNYMYMTVVISGDELAKLFPI